MAQSNPYQSPSMQEESQQSTDSVPYSYGRGVTTYIASCLFLWAFVVPLIAPTDVPPAGAPPIPAHLVALQVFVGYGFPGVLVYTDWRRLKSGNRS